MIYSIRKAQESDFQDIFLLINELASFERASNQVINSVAQMQEEKEFFHCYLAENNKQEIVGMAVYFFAYYTWVGKTLYLDDLYVKKAYRGNKIGKTLLNQIFEVAQHENCKRVRWQVLDWNSRAIELYQKCGATIDASWHNCDFDVKTIQDFNKQNT